MVVGGDLSAFVSGDAVEELADLAFQFGIARTVMRHEALPAEVALALSELLSGNLTKVLISIGIWLPYLLMSKRINLTYRHRLPA